MWPKVPDDVVEGHPQMFHQGNLRAGSVVEGHSLTQNAEVTRLLYVCHSAENQPQRVVIKATAYVVVAALGKGLILVVAAAVGKLGGGYVDDSLPGPLGDLVHKTYKILIGITKTHSAAYTALKERCRAGHVEGNHALVLVPDVHHPV